MTCGSEVGRGVRLHIRRVFVMEDTGQLMPQYLRFVRGVIDSSDLPLNISRELLQGSRVVDNIRSNAVKKVLRLLADLAENEPEKYATFWKEFGTILKEGVADDFGNRDEIAKLLRFTSTKSATDEADVSLADYVGRMKEGQKDIYYLLAPWPGRRPGQPAPGGVPQEGRRGPAAGRGEGVDNWVVSQPARVRRQAAAVGRPGQRRPGPLEDEAESQAKEQARRRVRRAGRQAEGRTWPARPGTSG